MRLRIALLAVVAAALLPRLPADPLFPRPKADPQMKPEDTDVWSPVPPVVTAPEGTVPSDAIVLFDGRNLDAWAAHDESPPRWKIEDGTLVVVPGTGDLRTKASFGDLQLHAEFRSPAVVVGSSQGRGNSGIFFMGLYELQVLDSYQNPTYVNGQAGAVYKQSAPLVNPARPPGQWQTYDAVWIAPRFTADGRLASPARITVFYNGVLVQHDFTLLGPTMNQGKPAYVAHPARLPLVLQEHHNPVAFRNIWVRELSLPSSP